MIKALPDPLYYLWNFHTVLDWVARRYPDLLTSAELAVMERFANLPVASRALMVRMVMRKGDLFRASRLRYREIGCARAAVRPLVSAGLIDEHPALTLDELFDVSGKPELARIFGASFKSGSRKADQADALRERFPGPRRFREWHTGSDDCVYRVHVAALCERIRLMFFGNLHQDWSEFVLSELGVFRYEKVELDVSSRAFHTRTEVDDFLHLERCRDRLEQGVAPAEILAAVPHDAFANAWLESRRARLLFRLAWACERAGDAALAHEIYSRSAHPGARVRAIRVLARSEQTAAALELARGAQCAPESETERQQLLRIIPRLARKLGAPRAPAVRVGTVTRIELTLPRPHAPCTVEGLVRDSLMQADAPVHYVENVLINSLFGLLCWDVIFAALPGAFFHPFHRAPADLLSPDFYHRRKAHFDAHLDQLDTGEYRETVTRNFSAKAGIQSPFVAWGGIDETLLARALRCLPAMHLRKCFERILADVPANRSGLPDLIQFWPQEQRYLMLEVKGPGDRLQDNQTRWLDYFVTHDMPVSVCYVKWSETAH